MQSCITCSLWQLLKVATTDRVGIRTGWCMAEKEPSLVVLSPRREERGMQKTWCCKRGGGETGNTTRADRDRMRQNTRLVIMAFASD
jgi:hypothetical protein